MTYRNHLLQHVRYLSSLAQVLRVFKIPGKIGLKTILCYLIQKCPESHLPFITIGDVRNCLLRDLKNRPVPHNDPILVLHRCNFKANAIWYVLTRIPFLHDKNKSVNQETYRAYGLGQK